MRGFWPEITPCAALEGDGTGDGTGEPEGQLQSQERQTRGPEAPASPSRRTHVWHKMSQHLWTLSEHEGITRKCNSAILVLFKNEVSLSFRDIQ